MGIDHGIARMGIAISDPLCIVARPYSIIVRRSKKADFRVIQRILYKENIRKIVIGLPTNSRGEVGKQALVTIRWAVKLSEAVQQPIVFWDESFSSQEAAKIQGRGSERRARLDDIAAAVILQEYLDIGETDHEPGQTLEALKKYL